MVTIERKRFREPVHTQTVATEFQRDVIASLYCLQTAKRDRRVKGGKFEVMYERHMHIVNFGQLGPMIRESVDFMLAK